jgi:nucleoside-diphosphate-sugar epimerase
MNDNYPGKQFSALISGGTGFIGSNLARRLIQKGWNVHLIVRPESLKDLIQDIAGKSTYHVFRGQTDQMSEIVRNVRPDIVFHLASYFRAEHVSSDIEPMLKSNLIFATQLMDAMASEGVRLMVNAGTAWQHYEGREYSPVCLYAATKQAFEALMQYYIEAYGVSVITLKLTDTYGSNDPRPKLLNQIRKASAEGTTLAMSPGGQDVDFVHVDDVVEAFCMAADLLLGGKTSGHMRYWVSRGKQQSLRNFVEEFVLQEGLNVKINWGARNYRRREMMSISPIHSIIFDVEHH